jgi:hypothetical protein
MAANRVPVSNPRIITSRDIMLNICRKVSEKLKENGIFAPKFNDLYFTNL